MFVLPMETEQEDKCDLRNKIKLIKMPQNLIYNSQNSNKNSWNWCCNSQNLDNDFYFEEKVSSSIMVRTYHQHRSTIPFNIRIKIRLITLKPHQNLFKFICTYVYYNQKCVTHDIKKLSYVRFSFNCLFLY